MPGLSLSERLESFIRLRNDVAEFLEQMPVYTKRDGAAVIYAFNSLFDIAWKLMKDSLSEWYGLDEVRPSPRDIIREAAAVGLIDTPDTWLEMLRNRNLSTHDYMRTNQEYYCRLIGESYLPLMDSLVEKASAQVQELARESSQQA